VVADPPLLAGAVHETVACALPATAPTPVGAPGAVAGALTVTDTEFGPVPTMFVALTVTEYELPATRPPMTHVVGVGPVVHDSLGATYAVATSLWVQVVPESESPELHE
jgi:hypothetical protein